MSKYLYILFLVFCSNLAYTQQVLELKDLHYRDNMSMIRHYRQKSFHSSVKPEIRLNDAYKVTTYNQYIHRIGYVRPKSSRGKELNWFGKELNPVDSDLIRRQPLRYRYDIHPIVDLGVGFDNNGELLYRLGGGLAVNFNARNWLVTGKFMPYASETGFLGDSIRNSQIDFGTTRSLSGSTFWRGELIGAYRPNRFFTFLGGYGKNVFGEGYRSLLLSDNAAGNPFLKIETTFAGVKYVNLFNVWNDFYSEPNDRSKDMIKFSAMHYLSWNITNSFNLSLFETVIWQGRDSLATRFFEPNYLNPFVFYRPVEYAQGSADNVLVGLNLSYKTRNYSTIYYQLILDEFLVRELTSDNKWWGNKYGMQLGAKSTAFIIPELYAQLEFNFVRPFTYSHKETPQVYGHANSSVAHPLGANFYELNSILSYRKGQHRITNHLIYSGFGADYDSSAVSYGQNIFNSYSNRSDNFGHTIMQGEKHNVFSFVLIYEYKIEKTNQIFLSAKYKLRSDITPGYHQINHFFEVGLRTRIWNVFDDI